MLLLIALLAAGDPQGAPDAAVERMVALYDEVCLKAFPDDAAVDALMAAKGATPLTPEQAKVTLRDDPGRGWLLTDGDRDIQIMLELPPYHACSVRRMTERGFGDLAGYRAVAAAYGGSHPGFTPIERQEMDLDGLHIEATGEIRELPGGAAETLYLFEQRVADPARRAKGETAVSVRFVHQFVAAEAH